MGSRHMINLPLCRGEQAFVHWWYLPESYDEYVPRESVPDQLQLDIMPGSGVWKVYLRWVYDSEKYNEWMNAADYETKEAQDEHEQGKLAQGGATGMIVGAISGLCGMYSRPILNLTD